jgi:hypothetical protein
VVQPEPGTLAIAKMALTEGDRTSWAQPCQFAADRRLFLLSVVPIRGHLSPQIIYSASHSLMAMLKSALSEAAAAAVRTGTFLGERYRRIVKRSPGYYAIHIGQDRKAHNHVASWRPSAHPLSAA